MNPTPEEKCKVGCMCGSGYASDCKVHNPSPEARCAYEHLPDRVCMKCGKYEPAPEARVDWENEAREIAIALSEWSRKYPKDTVHSATYDKKCNDELYAIEKRAKALSNAFEKGREAR